MTTLYPFTAAMAIGLGRLGLSPADFWRMTPRELDAAIGGLTGKAFNAQPRRSALTDLMRQFPDRNRQGNKEGRDDA